MTQPYLPIGVFDSGIGGLSILDALLQALPHEHFVYFSDAGHAPYGERNDAFVQLRCQQIVQQLLTEHPIKALVVACNTATTVAIEALREDFPALPIIGVEPAIKPAMRITQTGHIAVLATERTLQSGKYQRLRQSLSTTVRVDDIACPGLAGAIEANDVSAIAHLCERFLAQALRPSAAPVDTVVLGCTHYPLVLPALQRHAPPKLRFVDSAAAVARHTALRLQAQRLLRPPADGNAQAGLPLTLLTSGSLPCLQAAAQRHLHGDARDTLHARPANA